MNVDRGGTGHEFYTVLGCGSASGQRLAPFILYKGKNISDGQ